MVIIVQGKLGVRRGLSISPLTGQRSSDTRATGISQIGIDPPLAPADEYDTGFGSSRYNPHLL